MDLLNDELYQMISDDFNNSCYAINSKNCLNDEEQLASFNTYSMLDDLLFLNNQPDQQTISLNDSFNNLYTPLSPPLSSSLYDSFNDCSSSVSPNWDVNEMINREQIETPQNIKENDTFNLFQLSEPFVKQEVDTNYQIITVPSQQQQQQKPQILNVNKPSTKINIIKINHSSLTNAATTIQHKASCLKLPIAKHKINQQQAKTIVQYKLDSELKIANFKQETKVFPKPPYSYSCLIAMAFKNSDNGTLPVSEIYDFIIENFPYYKTARDGWKNSIRHNLSLNKCFEKIENPLNGSKKGCLWGLNPEKCRKVEEECRKCRQRDLINIKMSMSRPDDLMKIERGEQRLKKSNTIDNSNQRKTSNQKNYQFSNDLDNNPTSKNNSIYILNQTTDQLVDSFLQWPNISSEIQENIINEDCFNFDFRLLE